MTRTFRPVNLLERAVDLFSVAAGYQRIVFREFP